MRIGVLALQGAFAEHIAKLEELGVEGFEIRQRGDISSSMDGLILPGGESTVIGKLLRELELFAPLLSMIQEGLPVFGTCAGLLLLAKDVLGESALGFSTMDVYARRNAYGRQLGSFCAEGDFAGLGVIPMTFIRAPYIESVGPDVSVLAEEGGRIVAARQGRQLVTAFHPELGGDQAVHRYFLENLT
ncbi:MAG: pyridoxal 5'-phosphate synthase glutaminase subunit PdxT [Oscillospiraceae bacterium]|nr:pyridoxal 5'-phosphate synthase glutaminase subunit PdxT [Oscillospiraceae bacterium]